ncbi:phosphatase PAP2 family protein [Paenibacillus gansuensis]|uniref:Phosphatase PAP2 family protein n=1 Tax=Paenibacillus gansuensis TaxID=306542 RepID=A0ABW5PFU4_9BACL
MDSMDSTRKPSLHPGPKTKLTAALLVSFACAAVFIMLALLIDRPSLYRFDHAVIEAVQGTEAPWLTEIMKGFTFIGSGGSVALITLVAAVALYYVLGHRRELILLLGTAAGSALLNTILKVAFRRTRPDINRLIEITGYSFPSGHSMAAFTLYGVITYLLWKHAVSVWLRVLIVGISAVMIAGIGVSRIYLGVHYPSDVVGGFLASGCYVALSIQFYRKLRSRRERQADENRMKRV